MDVRPSITPAQIIGLLVAGVPAVAKLLQAFGVYEMTGEQTQALNDALQWAAIVAGALFVSDAGLRSARNVATAKVDAAIVTPVEPKVLLDSGLDEIADDDLPSDEEEFGPESGVEPDVPTGDRA